MYLFTHIKQKAPDNREVLRSVYSCRFSLRNLLYVTLPAPRIWKWPLEFIQHLRTFPLGHYIFHVFFILLRHHLIHPTIASLNLQEHLHIIEKWLKKWKIKVNESKSSHITFILRKGHCPAVNINQTIIPQTEAVKYLGLHRDCRLNWKEHIAKRKTNRLKNKRDQLDDRKKIPSICTK
jgi:hypothetical protein